mgnify:CR=1 FL=1
MTHKIKLATVCQQIRGVSYTPKDMAEIPTEGYIPILRANNIQEKLVFNELVYVNANKISKIQLLKGGDIVVCASSGSKNLVGKAARFVSSPVDQVSFGAFCKVVRPRNIDASYLSHFFNSSYYRNTISKIAQGANINNIRNEHLDNLDINVPTPSEQKRIAERLDKVQELIAKQKEQIAKLDLLIKSRFLDMFGDPVTNLKKWEIKTLKDLGDVMSGGTPSRSIPRYFGGDINWFSAGELNSLFLDRSLETITEEGLLYSNAKLFPAGSLLIGMYDTAAFKLGILKQQAAFNQACAAIFPKVVKVVWVYYVLSLLKQEVLKFRRGIRQKNLNLQFIRNVKVPVPPLNLQTQFVNFVKSVEQQKEVFSARLSHLEVLYKSLMQEYFG